VEEKAIAPDAAVREDTFPKLLIRNARLFGARASMRHKDLGIWQTWTWSETLEIVRAYAAGLHRLGLKRGDTISIVGTHWSARHR
jgi:long-chain acyl-CoA synthetase